MGLKELILNKAIEAQKDKRCVFSLSCGFQLQIFSFVFNLGHQ